MAECYEAAYAFRQKEMLIKKGFGYRKLIC